MNFKALLVSSAKRSLAYVSNVIDARDVLFFSGVAAICYGVYLMYPPAAFIVGGAVLAALGVIGGRN